jgi:hypothetical protein
MNEQIITIIGHCTDDFFNLKLWLIINVTVLPLISCHVMFNFFLCSFDRQDSDENSVSAVTVERVVRCTRSRGIPDHNYSKQKNAAQFSDSSQPAVDSQPLPSADG